MTLKIADFSAQTLQVDQVAIVTTRWNVVIYHLTGGGQEVLILKSLPRTSACQENILKFIVELDRLHLQ